MERYEANIDYQIVHISRSNEPLSMKEDNDGEGVSLVFLPYILLDAKNKTATTVLTSQFYGKDENPITNELIVHITYKFSNELPVVQDGDDKIKIVNNKDLFSIFDTSVGSFRGILFEWLEDSCLQHPLPIVNMGKFLKGLKYSFSK